MVKKENLKEQNYVILDHSGRWSQSKVNDAARIKTFSNCNKI